MLLILDREVEFYERDNYQRLGYHYVKQI